MNSGSPLEEPALRAPPAEESSAGSDEGPTVRVVCAGAVRLGLLLALAVTVIPAAPDAAAAGRAAARGTT